MVYDHQTKDVQGQGLSNIYLILFVCFFDIYRAFYHFLLLTMAETNGKMCAIIGEMFPKTFTARIAPLSRNHIATVLCFAAVMH